MNHLYKIYGVGHFCQPINVSEPLPSLKALLKQYAGASFRRTDRLTQLALIGASQSVGQHKIPENSGIYMGSAFGPHASYVKVLNDILKHKDAPMPLDFVNTVSNASCFYLSKHFQLQSRNISTSSHYLALEKNLQLALTDLEAGTIESALVGCSNEATFTFKQEQSDWLWVAKQSSIQATAFAESAVQSVEGAVESVAEIVQFKLLNWQQLLLKLQQLTCSNISLLYSNQITPSQQRQITSAISININEQLLLLEHENITKVLKTQRNKARQLDSKVDKSRVTISIGFDGRSTWSLLELRDEHAIT